MPKPVRFYSRSPPTGPPSGRPESAAGRRSSERVPGGLAAALLALSGVAGAETGWHRHGFDYVITTLTECQMLLEEPGGGSRQVTIPAGTAYRRQEGVEHNVVNAGDGPMSFVEVELK